jgi:non-ribosomal peptide synthetase component F
VFLRDVFYAYSEIRQKGAVCWPADPLQFQVYAASQRREHGRWREKHARYWSEHMHGYERVQFPADQSHVGPFSGWGSVSISVDGPTLARLLECSRLRRTTPAMAACTAFVCLIARWCNASDIVLQYIVDGRSDPLLENAIGCFATRLSLRVVVRDDDTLIDVQKRVVKEYCRAHEHADAGYIESQMPRPEFLRSCAFNWIPREPEAAATAESARMHLHSRDIPFEHPMLDTMEKDHDPVLLLFASSTALSGSILFPRSRFSEGYFERFRDAYLQILEQFISRPEARIRQLIQD